MPTGVYKRKKRTAYHKRRISEGLIAKYQSDPSYRVKNSLARKGRPGGMLGKKHTAETRKKMRAARKGAIRPKHSEAAKAKIKAGQLCWWEAHPEARQQMAERVAIRFSQWPGEPTNLEINLYWLLDVAGVSCEPQKRFGRYVVDAYVPSHQLVFEADGKYWHQDIERQKRRDAYLLGNPLVQAVIHLDDKDLAVRSAA